MAGYLVAKRGTLSNLVISLQKGSQWTLGSDPREASIVLKDPLISKRHVICHLTPKGYILENLDLYHPARINGKIIAGKILLQENDVLTIGGLFFQFTEKKTRIRDNAPSVLCSVAFKIDSKTQRVEKRQPPPCQAIPPQHNKLERRGHPSELYPRRRNRVSDCSGFLHRRLFIIPSIFSKYKDVSVDTRL